jgi:branched-chain amino acid transport system substrate-binding protein
MTTMTTLCRAKTPATFRRQFLQAAASTALTTVLPKYAWAKGTVTVGYVVPQTGPLSPFGDPDAYVINTLKDQLAGRGILLEVRDSRSDPAHAAAVANELINNNISLMLVSSTPETTNPVADQCELAGVPCISTVSPWQAWFFNRGGDPATGFVYTYHFFWGLEDVIAIYTGMWSQLSTNKTIGGMFPSDGDGFAWGDPARGFPPALASQDFTLINPGQFPDLTPDFSTQIEAFKSNATQIITGVLIPPDFVNFWRQAKQRGLAVKIVTIGKALVFPATFDNLGDTGHNLSTEVWWTPQHPFTSSLTQQTAAQLAAAYTQATGKQWSQPLGFAHALCELAADVISRASDPTVPDKVLQALVSTNLQTIVGPIAWGSGPVKNVCKTPLVGGQWRLTPGGPNHYDLVITETGQAKNIPSGGQMQAMS